MNFAAQATTDGRGNAVGSCSAAAVLKYEGTVYSDAIRLMDCSNNEAEYEGVILALEMAKKLNVPSLSIQSDSKLIVYQTLGRWQVRQSHLLPYRGRVWELASNFDFVDISWIPRESNKEADSLCRQVVKPDWDCSSVLSPFR